MPGCRAGVFSLQPMSGGGNTKLLVLFDIDGTLIHPGTLARRLMNEAVFRAAGVSPDLKMEEVAGFTDPSIIRNALRKVRFNPGDLNEAVERVLNDYLTRLKAEYPSYDEPYLYPDAIELVRRCREEGWRVGLLSGNLREGAVTKLARFDLWDEFEFGVFGDDGANREDLLWRVPELAWEALSEAYPLNRVVLVGDTPNDARIANMNGVRSLIVCRRAEWKRKIEAEDPTWLVDSFRELDEIIGWLSMPHGRGN
ncbi:MAG: HAD family hydrolase [Fidelibacterota bacterium]